LHRLYWLSIVKRWVFSLLLLRRNWGNEQPFAIFAAF